MMTDITQDFLPTCDPSYTHCFVDDSETDSSVSDLSNPPMNDEDDGLDFLDFGGEPFWADDTNELFVEKTTSQPIGAPRVKYPDGTVVDLSSRLNPLACSQEEWVSYGLAPVAWYTFAQQAASPDTQEHVLMSLLVEALSSSEAVRSFMDLVDSAPTFVLPNYARRCDAVTRRKYFVQGVDLEDRVRGGTADADQGMWQRTFNITSSEAVGLMQSASRGDWAMIAEWLEHYTSTNPKHWSVYVDGSGVTNLHFDPATCKTATAAAAPAQPLHVPGWNGGQHLCGAKAVVEKYQQSRRSPASRVTSSSSDDDSDEEAATTCGEESSSCCSSSGEESDHDHDDDHSSSGFPGPRGPLGAELPDRGRHICRVDGCARFYRWPDYKCGVHGGGRCQFQHWVEGAERCTRFHQSKNSRGELLCGRHSRATNALYGEEKRKPKATRGSTHKKGAAAKAKKRAGGKGGSNSSSRS